MVPASRRVLVAPRRAYAAPLKMIPTAAMNSAIDRVEAMEPNAVGYAVHITVSTNTSQT